MCARAHKCAGHKCAGVHGCVHVPGGQGRSQAFCSISFYHIPLRQELLLKSDLGWQSANPSYPFVLVPRNTEITDAHGQPWLFTCVLGSKLRASYLCRKHFYPPIHFSSPKIVTFILCQPNFPNNEDAHTFRTSLVDATWSGPWYTAAAVLHQGKRAGSIPLCPGAVR